MFSRKNIIIIGSSGRNNGKTEFACRLIKKLSLEQNVIGVKITTIKENGEKCPRGEKGCGVCGTLTTPFELSIETNSDSHKDTSRMLKSGAKKVFWLRVLKSCLAEGINELLKNIPNNAIVVCESNSSRLNIEPGLFIIIKNPIENTIKQSCLEVYHYANKIIYFKENNWDFSPDRINYNNGKWYIRENASAVILAGGLSSRMGEDKSMLSIDDQPLISIIADQLKPVFDEVVIGTNDIKKFNFLNLRIIQDIEKNKGPLMGILSCLKSSNSDINFITACDIPLMNLQFIKDMIHIAKDYDIVVPVSAKNKYETLFAVYNKRITGIVEDTIKSNKSRIIEIFDKLNVHFIKFKNRDWYYNLNTKQNYYSFLQKETIKNG